MDSKTDSGLQSFIGDIFLVALSRILITLVGVVLLPFLSKYYSVDIYAVWIQIWATVNFLLPLFTLQFQTALIRFLITEQNRTKRQHAFGSMLWLILAFGLMSLLVSWLLKDSLSRLLFASPDYANLIPLAISWSLTWALFHFSTSYFQARGKTQRFAVAQSVMAIIRIVLIAVLTTGGYSLNWMITCLILAEIPLIVVVIYMVTRDSGIPWPTFSEIPKYLSFSLPQIPAGIMTWAIIYIDRYFITHMLGLAQTGIYSASYTVASFIGLLFVPIYIVLLPKASQLWDADDLIAVKKYFENSIKLFLTLSIPILAGIVVLSQPLIKILSTSDYMAGELLVLLLGIAMILSGLYIINSRILFLTKQTHWLPLIAGIAAAINIGINVFIIPKVGIIGAAISSIVAYLVLATVVTIWVRRVVNCRIDFKFLAKVLFSTIIMTLCLWFIKDDSIPRLIFSVLVGVLIFCLCLWMTKALSTQDIRLIRQVFSWLPWAKQD